MSSGRSARLPPTPNTNVAAQQQYQHNNKHRVVVGSGGVGVGGGGAAVTASEQNSNNVLPYNSNNMCNAASNAQTSMPSHPGSVGSCYGSGLGMGRAIGSLSYGMNSAISGMTNINSTGTMLLGSNAAVAGSVGIGHVGSVGTLGAIDPVNACIPGEDTISALGNEMMSQATSQALENLSENERKMIIEVLNRDEVRQRHDATRIMLLRAELLSLRCKGALKLNGAGGGGLGGGSATLDGTQQQQQQNSQQQQQQQQQPDQYQVQQQQQQQQEKFEHNNHNLHDSNRHCARCNIELGRITNRGAPCRVCKLRVCKACREFTTRTTDWVCVVCHKQMEIQQTANNSGDWLKDTYMVGSGGDGEQLSETDVLRKSIRRSWTISNPEDDPNNPNAQNPVTDNLYPQQQNLIEAQSAGSYPSLHHQHSHQRPHPAASYNTGSAIGISGLGTGTGPIHTQSAYHVNAQRRVLRQSTLPSSLNNDPNLSGSGGNLANYNSANLTAPTSPHQIQKSPLYPSVYNSDNIAQMNTNDDNYENYAQQQKQQQQQQQQQQPEQPLPINIQPAGAVPQQQPPQDQTPPSGISTPTHHRLQVRRQSTLPANPCQVPMYMSTSPNRIYSRSPERSPGEQRYPPFMRQTSFPCNMSSDPITAAGQHPTGVTPPTTSYGIPSPHHRTKLLPSTAPHHPQPQPPPPTSNYDQQAAPVDEMDYPLAKPRMMRQATLPNPDQHMKLLPTSPPKRQTSPQFRRSPEFMRQQTLPNPEAFTGNSLTVQPPHGLPNSNSQAKFMPISPRAKQNFLFPNVQNPRQFLSQQHVPTLGSGEVANSGIVTATGEQYSSSQSVNIHNSRDPHAKMIKVRSHSNEEYSNSKATHPENRRLLPEIPTNRTVSRSPSRLVRQDCLKDDRTMHDMHGSRTFGEAKQQFNQFQDVTEEEDNRPEYMDYFGDSTTSFLESDEVQYNEKHYNSGFSSEPRIIYNDGSDDGSGGSYNPQYQRPMVYSAENMLANEPNYGASQLGYYASGMEGFKQSGGTTGSGLSMHSASPSIGTCSSALPRTPQMHNRMRRRQSRELQIQQEEYAQVANALAGVEAANTDADETAAAEAGDKQERRKPEQMRSVSEDSGNKSNAPKPVTRRSFSHPEKDTQPPKKSEPTKIPSPRPLADILDKSRVNSKIPTPMRRNSRAGIGDDGKQPQLPQLPQLPHQKPATNGELKSNAGQQQQQHHESQQSMQENHQSQQNEHSNENDNNQNEAETKTETNKNQNDANKTHTSTLGEQEIQNAVEAAAVVFKKVVLQRRKEKQAAAAEEAEYSTDANDMETSSETEFRSITINQKQYNVDADEFKLVFLNSDSSSSCKEEEEEEDDDGDSKERESDVDYETAEVDYAYAESSASSNSSSTRQCNSIIIDDCDWDYFEPAMTAASHTTTTTTTTITMQQLRRKSTRRRKSSDDSTNSPMDSPLLYRKRLRGSGFCARIRESDTATDEDISSVLQEESSSDRELPHLPIPITCTSLQQLWNARCTNCGTHLAQQQNDLQAFVAAYSGASVNNCQQPVAQPSQLTASMFDSGRLQHLACAGFKSTKQLPTMAKSSSVFSQTSSEVDGAANIQTSTRRFCTFSDKNNKNSNGDKAYIDADKTHTINAIIESNTKLIPKTSVLVELNSPQTSNLDNISKAKDKINTETGKKSTIATTPRLSTQLTASLVPASNKNKNNNIGTQTYLASNNVGDGDVLRYVANSPIWEQANCQSLKHKVEKIDNVQEEKKQQEEEEEPQSTTKIKIEINVEVESNRQIHKNQVLSTPAAITSFAVTAHPQPKALAQTNTHLHTQSEQQNDVGYDVNNDDDDDDDDNVVKKHENEFVVVATKRRDNTATALCIVDKLNKKENKNNNNNNNNNSSSSSTCMTANINNNNNKNNNKHVIEKNNKNKENAKNAKIIAGNATVCNETLTYQQQQQQQQQQIKFKQIKNKNKIKKMFSFGKEQHSTTKTNESAHSDSDSDSDISNNSDNNAPIGATKLTTTATTTTITATALAAATLDVGAGYLQSECVGVYATSDTCSVTTPSASSSSSSSSNEIENDEAQKDKKVKKDKKLPRRKALQRSYDVTIADTISEIVPREHDTTTGSSIASSTSSSSESYDSDDTGTIADRRPKKRRFNKVFVVNRNAGPRIRRAPGGNGAAGGGDLTTDSDTFSSSDANLEDSSDNDTDTERTDCGIILNYVKPINEDANHGKTAAVVGGSDLYGGDPTEESEQSDVESERVKKRANSSTAELADCIVVVGGITDDSANGGVVLNAIRRISSDHDNDVGGTLPISAAGSCVGIISKKVAKSKQNKLINNQHSTESEQLTTKAKEIASFDCDDSSDNVWSTQMDNGAPTETATEDAQAAAAAAAAEVATLGAEDACEQLHSISNDVNRLLALHKQNSELEIKLQKLRRGVAEINEDHLQNQVGDAAPDDCADAEIMKQYECSFKNSNSGSGSGSGSNETKRQQIVEQITTEELQKQRKQIEENEENDLANKLQAVVEVEKNNKKIEIQTDTTATTATAATAATDIATTNMAQCFVAQQQQQQQQQQLQTQVVAIAEAPGEQITNICASEKNFNSNKEKEKEIQQQIYDDNEVVKSETACKQTNSDNEKNNNKNNIKVREEHEIQQVNSKETKAQCSAGRHGERNETKDTTTTRELKTQVASETVCNEACKTNEPITLKTTTTTTTASSANNNDYFMDSDSNSELFNSTNNFVNVNINNACTRDSITPARENITTITNKSNNKLNEALKLLSEIECQAREQLPQQQQQQQVAEEQQKEQFCDQVPVSQTEVCANDYKESTKELNQSNIVGNTRKLIKTTVEYEMLNVADVGVKFAREQKQKQKQQQQQQINDQQLQENIVVGASCVSVSDVNSEANANICCSSEVLNVLDKQQQQQQQPKSDYEVDVYESVYKDNNYNTEVLAYNNDYDKIFGSCQTFNKKEVKSTHEGRGIGSGANGSASGNCSNISTSNTLSAKYRSLIMITKENNSNESATTTPTITAKPMHTYTHTNTNTDESASAVNMNVLDSDVLARKQNQENHFDQNWSSSYYGDNIGNNSVADDSLQTHLNTSVATATATATTTTSAPTSKQLTKINRNQINHCDNNDRIYEFSDNVETKQPATVCLEDGLADDDSWVEELSQHGDEELVDTTPTASDSEGFSIDGDIESSADFVRGMFIDREEELRGYHRSAIDFTLHTIVEESCEESEVASSRADNDDDLDTEDIEDNVERRKQRTLQHHHRLSASELEKYFFFGLGDGKVTLSSIDTRGDDTESEVSSECSEGLDSIGAEDTTLYNSNATVDLASSRLEKYFLSGFMGGFGSAEKNESDESGGSVGSDSEGHPSPSNRRKRLVRARGTPRSHNSSLDNLLVDTQLSNIATDSLEAAPADTVLNSSESEACDDTVIHISAGERASDGSSSDTIKRKKQVRKRHDSLDEKKFHDALASDDVSKLIPSSTSAECRTPTPNSIAISAQAKKQQHHSRDSGFVGSNDDLLKTAESEPSGSSGSFLQVPNRSPTALQQISEDKETATTPLISAPIPELRFSKVEASTSGLITAIEPGSKKVNLPPPATSSNLVRKDSFNNWSSDEETNLMMSKMRQFFKTLIVATANAQQNHGSNISNSSKSTTPNQTTPISMRRMKTRPAQLAYFENELTRLMKTVPGINDEQVREIVEYLSSEDAWSDSYDSSDYTSSDLEGSNRHKVELKAQISESCQQIINKFEVDEEGDRGDGGLIDETHGLNPETAIVYQKLVASFSKIAVGNANNTNPNVDMPPQNIDITNTETNGNGCVNIQHTIEDDQISNASTHSADRSPQLFAKVMQHIGTRLVALMHEVSSGNETHGNNTPQQAQRHHHHHHYKQRLQAKISATTTEDEEEDEERDFTQSELTSRSQLLHPSSAAQQHYHHHYQQLKIRRQQEDDAINLARSKSHDLLLDSTGAVSTGGNSGATSSGSNNASTTYAPQRPYHHQSSSGVSDTAGEECGVASDYERFSWRGSFESALLANGDSRTKLSQLDRDNSSSASALAVAKRRSAGDLLFNHKSLSREQLDRVRSCGSIGGGDEHHHQLEASPAKPWLSSCDSTKDVRRSSVPDAIYESDSSDEGAAFSGGVRSTLPRSLIGVTQVASTNSLPRLPTTNTGAAGGIGGSSSCSAITSTPTTKSQSALNFPPSPSTPSNIASARYRSPGLATRAASTGTKKTATLGLQQFLYSKRDARKRLNMSVEEAKAAAEELSHSPVIGQRNDPTTSPLHSRGSASSETWPAQSDEDIDRLVAMHQNRSSLSSLGVRSESMASVYSGAGEGRYGTVVVKGQVEFGMQYNYKLGALEIHVVRCKDLAAVDSKRNRSDPYVKVYLLPDKSKAGKRKTKVKKHTLNPIFDETLRFHTPISSLESRTLWLTVWHSDMFGRNDFLGEVSVNLQGRVFDNPQSQWYLLQERSEPYDEVATYRGDIVVGLKFIPPECVRATSFSRGSSTSVGGSNLRKFGGSIKSAATKSDRTSKGGQLHVLVKEAKHLSPIKANGTCDAFCKSYLLPDRTRSSKQKTPVVKRSLNPTWNYTFVYEDVSLEDLTERALELTVWDHDRLASNEFVGGIRFSLGTGKSFGRQVDWMDATGKELSLWQNMLDRPNFWVEGSLVLRSTLDGIRALP